MTMTKKIKLEQLIMGNPTNPKKLASMKMIKR